MKQVVFFNLFLFLFSNAVAQNNSLLEFRDGSLSLGLGEIKNKKTILFKKTKNSENEIYDYKTVKKITKYSNKSKKEYEYKIVEGSGGIIKLLKIDKVGKVNLYQDYMTVISTLPHTSLTGVFMRDGHYSSTKTFHYISKYGSDIVTCVDNIHSRKFKKIARKYFSSCPDLLEKINNKYFDNNDISSIVEYFNNKCNFKYGYSWESFVKNVDSLSIIEHTFYDKKGINVGVDYKNGSQIKEWKVHHENGELKIIGYYENRKAIGDWKGYYENGELMNIGKYNNGKKIGEWKFYHDNGELKAIGKYENGERNGKWKFYRGNGKPIQNVVFVNGILNGECKMYHKNGELETIGYYENGKAVGQWKVYNENGELDVSWRL